MLTNIIFCTFALSVVLEEFSASLYFSTVINVLNSYIHMFVCVCIYMYIYEDKESKGGQIYCERRTLGFGW